MSSDRLQVVEILTIQPISALEFVMWGAVNSCLSSYCWWQVAYICTSASESPFFHKYYLRWKNTSLSFRIGLEIQGKNEKKIVTCNIMQAAHLNPSLPGTYTLRARIQPTCEWAPCHLSRWAWKSAASRPCMCINGGC